MTYKTKKEMTQSNISVISGKKKKFTAFHLSHIQYQYHNKYLRTN